MLPLRCLQMLGDRAAQADDRHLLDPVAARQPAAQPVPDAGGDGDIGVEVLLGDAAAGPGAGHELQLDAGIPGAPPHRRRRQRLFSRAAAPDLTPAVGECRHPPRLAQTPSLPRLRGGVAGRTRRVCPAAGRARAAVPASSLSPHAGRGWGKRLAG